MIRLTLKVVLLSTLAACSGAAEPSREQIENYLQSTLPSHIDVTVGSYQVFPGELGAGRISVSQTNAFLEPLYRPVENFSLQRYMRDEIGWEEDWYQLLRRIDDSISAIPYVPTEFGPDTPDTFENEIYYSANSNGFEFSYGGIRDGLYGIPERELPSNAQLLGSPGWDFAIKEIIDVSEARTALHQSILDRVNYWFAGSELSMYCGTENSRRILGFTLEPAEDFVQNENMNDTSYWDGRTYYRRHVAFVGTADVLTNPGWLIERRILNRDSITANIPVYVSVEAQINVEDDNWTARTEFALAHDPDNNRYQTVITWGAGALVYSSEGGIERYEAHAYSCGTNYIVREAFSDAPQTVQEVQRQQKIAP